MLRIIIYGCYRYVAHISWQNVLHQRKRNVSVGCNNNLFPVGYRAYKSIARKVICFEGCIKA